MTKSIALFMTAILTLALGCGDDDSSDINNLTNNGNNASNANNLPNNANNANNGNNANNSNLEAQRTAEDLFTAVMNLTLTNILAGANAFEEDGTEGETPCAGAIGVQGYGTMNLDYADGSIFAEWQATASLDGCLAMESGSNPPIEFTGQDPSGDGTPDIYTIDGTIAAMTFDEDGFPPTTDEMFPFMPDYDPDAEPTCSNVVFDGVLLEAFAVAPDEEMFTNTEESYSEGGYTAGTITADCGGLTIQCDLNGGQVPLATLSLSAVTASKDRDSICAYTNTL